ncbi:hypothetical protein BDY19DRAFT_1069340 [Irpex rosettiformis]|uniref:Uncharacterized protein n=1 Tax=Irpex rosettiformis TaxID=378272 RepID=A0ACB8U839_9APHY|nr:hypothetical protein BDY19DRAFT_1069340 [Irpex rosettiformis]
MSVWLPATTLPLSPVVKIPLLFAGAAGMHVTFTPPNPTPEPDEASKYGYKPSYTWFNISRNLATITLTYFHQVLHWINAVGETAVILATAFPSTIESGDIVHALAGNSGAGVRITTSSIIGFSLMAFGGLTRFLSYREMGRLYTWELSVKRGHHLVTTGPYSVVRHPGYSAIGLATVGSIYGFLGPGSLLWEGGYLDSTSGKVFAGLWAFYQLATTAKLWQRCPVEDRVLREQFPEEWEAWAKKTPYKLIPFVY